MLSKPKDKDRICDHYILGQKLDVDSKEEEVTKLLYSHLLYLHVTEALSRLIVQQSLRNMEPRMASSPFQSKHREQVLEYYVLA